ncbi:MAG: hypothetical protein IPP98_09945 [Gemmatimonadetes bacterium]|nr:hypothetical protein [Gemmatimonadota bacterium]
MKTPRAFLALCGAAVTATPLAAQSMRTVATSRPVGGERIVHAIVEFGAGVVHVGAAKGTDLYRMQLRYDAARNTPVHRYDARTGTLRLGLEGNGSAGLRVTSRAQMSQRADFDFSSTVPMTLEANLGASDATLDLGGMTLLSLTVRGGASRSTVTFATPNRGECSRADFALGAAELDVTGLANAGCAEIHVDGGVGKAELSFDGAWRRDLTADVSLAMGGLTLRIPRGTGVRLVASRFLSSLDAEGFTRAGDTWTTPGFEQAKHKLTVTVNASAAGVTVAWLPK